MKTQRNTQEAKAHTVKGRMKRTSWFGGPNSCCPWSLGERWAASGGDKESKGNVPNYEFVGGCFQVVAFLRGAEEKRGRESGYSEAGRKRAETGFTLCLFEQLAPCETVIVNGGRWRRKVSGSDNNHHHKLQPPPPAVHNAK